MLLRLLIATCAVAVSCTNANNLQWLPEADLLTESDPMAESDQLAKSDPLSESDQVAESDQAAEPDEPMELEEAWRAFKINHVKKYSDQTEEMRRKNIFAENLKSIHENNEEYKKGIKTFTMAVNQFADMDDSEFMKFIGDYVAPEDLTDVSSAQPEVKKNLTYPSHLDWRSHGWVTRVKRQGNCGSGWAFSATGALEGQYKRRTGRLVSLSEQQLIDCSYGNYGCYGGWPHSAFAYIAKNHGIDQEGYYAYAGRDGCCRYRCSYRGAMCRSYVRYWGISEYSLLVQLYHVGPLSVAIDASQRSFRFYRRGVYYEPRCKKALGQLNHKVLLVGYGSCVGRPYWTVKNSFGTGWGMGGYIRMARNHYNNCGIASYVSYPVV